MADTGARRVCDNVCGCTIPCAGDSTCRCIRSESASEVDHTTCSCGEHCGCNPCGCPKNVATGTGCKCSSTCKCTSCHT